MANAELPWAQQGPCIAGDVNTHESFVRGQQLRLHFRTIVGHCMCQEARGWLSDPAYFNAWDTQMD